MEFESLIGLEGHAQLKTNNCTYWSVIYILIVLTLFYIKPLIINQIGGPDTIFLALLAAGIPATIFRFQSLFDFQVPPALLKVRFPIRYHSC